MMNFWKQLWMQQRWCGTVGC
ncbi:hypothetical protein Goshw_013735 [Gossypium schwendimanii]|uniref:Uncharacterized protein n=1 Tax=Gossypium schwendimanii TaxID=34291 RepID=A0A7J9MTF8_GOSSC|nr:hypothetical protein [Gossypium schwendimanii]